MPLCRHLLTRCGSPFCVYISRRPSKRTHSLTSAAFHSLNSFAPKALQSIAILEFLLPASHHSSCVSRLSLPSLPLLPGSVRLILCLGRTLTTELGITGILRLLIPRIRNFGLPQTPLRLAATPGTKRCRLPPPSQPRKMARVEIPEQPPSLNLRKKKAATPGMHGSWLFLRLRLSREPVLPDSIERSIASSVVSAEF